GDKCYSYNGTVSDVALEMKDRSLIWYIVDEKYYKELEKGGVLIYILLWDVDELEKGFYCILGPSDKIEEEYKKMWSKKTIWAVATRSNNISHRIIHINTLNYLSSSYIFVSVYIEKRIMNKIMTEEKQKLKEFLQASEGEGQISPIRRTLFEGVTHRCLQNGGTFTIHHYNRPIARNFSSSDAISPSDYIYQITISKNYAIKWALLEAIIKKLDEIYNDNKRNIRFHFVVSEDKFGNYPEQKFLYQNGK
ncbi:4689_t:CDS:2, partial [Funneliformis geosporum]